MHRDGFPSAALAASVDYFVSAQHGPGADGHFGRTYDDACPGWLLVAFPPLDDGACWVFLGPGNLRRGAAA